MRAPWRPAPGRMRRLRPACRPHARLLLLLALASCNRVALRPGEAEAPPSVLLVTIDTLRADHVGAYGAAWAETPTLDRLAAEGTRFETAIASSPLTLPSHASLLTGDHPPRVGVRHNGVYRLQPSASTLTERLQESGYATAAFVSAFVLAARFGLDQGFDLYDDETSGQIAGPGGYAERDARAVTDRALAWVATAPRPFFLWIHYYDPHASYRPPPAFAERFSQRPYDGEIAYVDAELARLVGSLGDELDRTLVVVTADHGESLGEHGETDHGYSLYDAVLRIPLILRGPQVPVGRQVARLVRSVDVAPTVLSLLGLPPLEGIEGRDLRPLWQGGEDTGRIAYAETLATELELGWSRLHAIRSEAFHYVRAPRPELYDLKTDARQTQNLLAQTPPQGEPIARELDAHIDAILAQGREVAPERLDSDALERLQALGYALPAEPVQPTGLDPKDGLPLVRDLGAAHAAYAEDDFARAEALLERVLAGMPHSSRAHALLAYVLLHTDRVAEALPHMEAAARLSPRSARYHAMVGEIQKQLGDAAASRAAFQAAVALDPAEPLAQVALMQEAARLGDLAAAERHGARALAGDPLDAMVRVKVGGIWAAMGQHERSLAAFQQAVEVEPELEYAHMLLAIALARLGRAEQAEQERSQAGALGSDPRLMGRLGLAHAASGDLARARAVLREMRVLHPEREAARRTLARAVGEAEPSEADSHPADAS